VYESYQAYAVGHNADVAKSFLATRLDELGEETRLRDLVSVALKALVKTCKHHS
jgi:20S proteasome alpha/beta subunit